MADPVVYVVDDEPSVCRALCQLFASAGLVAEAFPSAEAFLGQLLLDRPSCLVVDLHLGPGRSGLDLQAQLGNRQHSIPIIFITGVGDVQASVCAMKAGAFDVLEKPVGDEALLASVHGALVLSRQQARVQAAQRKVEDRLAQLTPRELQVLWLVVRGGRTNSQMAARLGVAEKTIKAHRSRITSKMQTRSQPRLFRMIERLDVNRVRHWFGNVAADRTMRWRRFRSTS